MRTPSKLYNRLKDAPKPLFVVTDGTNNLDDNEVSSISTHHGGSIEGSYTPGTASFTQPGLPKSQLSSGITISLSSAFSEWIDRRTGYAVPSTLFTGRIGISEVEDRGAARKTRHVTKISAASWGSLLPSSTRRVPANRGGKLNVLIAQAFSHPQLGDRIPISAGAQSSYDEVWEPQAEVDFQTAVGKYGSDVGICVVQQSTGQVYIRTLEDLATYALRAVETVPAITEGQVLPSATWSQPIDVQAGPVHIRMLNTAAGATYTMGWEPPTGSIFPFEPIKKDLTYINSLTPSVSRYGKALVWRNNYRRTGIEKVSIRIDHLLSSPNEYDREVAGYLLSIEPFSVITLAGDWHRIIRGAQVVVAFEHEINPDGWTLTIELTTFRNAFGLTDAEIPPVPARIWDQLDDELWDDQEREWDNF